MATLKTNQTVRCNSLEEARVRADKTSNGVIVMKDGNYSIVNYKAFEGLKTLGYTQVR
jgi:hypothetical protein